MEDEDEELCERRENEVEALKSIFGEDLVDLREHDVWRVGRPPEMTIHLEPANTSRGSQKSQCCIDLKLKMTKLYPKSVPELSIAQSQGLSQSQQDVLLELLSKTANKLEGEEMVYELCIETQNFLAKHGGKIFSSFHEEMEERRKAEERRKSEGHDRLASLDRQAMADEVIQRQKEIEEEELKFKEEAKLKSQDDKNSIERKDELPNGREEPTRVKEENQRLKRYSESEDIAEPAQRFKVHLRSATCEVVKGRLMGENNHGSCCYSGIIMETGQLVAIHRWFINTGEVKRKVKFLDSDCDLSKQLASLETEVSTLHRIRHPHLVSYIGLVKSESTRDRRITLDLLQEFCRGTTLQIYFSGEQKMDLSCLKNVTAQVLLGLEHLHSLDIIHRNLRHTSIFIQQDGNVKIADFSVDLKIRETVCQHNQTLLEDDYPPSVGRGGKKCDIYRLGLILISLMDGVVVNDQTPKLPDKIPGSLEDFLTKCLMRDVRERWSADQLCEHSFIKEPLGKEIWWSTPDRNSEAQRSESPEPAIEDLPIEPVLIDNSKQSRLNQDFTIISWIGRGGFGDVIQVKNKLDDQTYAIKRIRLNPADRQLNRKIMREVKLLSRLNHENVVRYYNSWQEVTLVAPDSEEETTTTTEETTGDETRARLGVNSMSMLGFQPPSFKSSIPTTREDSEWSVSFMPPDSDSESDSDSDSESFANVAGFTQDSESERIVFCTESETTEDTEDSNLDQNAAKERREVQLNTLYIQMEFCEKKTLRNYIDSGLYKDTKKVWQMFREIVDGLVHIHTQGMIHRDLKPVNIFIDSQDHIKIGDFGLATTELLGAGPTEDRKEEIDANIVVEEDMTGLVGTALYTAPEVSRRNTTYNQKVDLYSLGVIFFEMCHPPLNTGMERIQVLTALRSPDIVFPEDWDSTLLRQQTYIVTWLLDHDPMKRPTSHELLLSDYLPPPHVEESRIEETVRNAMKNKKSKAYRHLINSCMSQPMSLPKDVHFDGDTVKPGIIRKLGAAYSLFRSAAEEVFARHGAVPLDAHLLLPVNNQNPWKNMETCVQVMTRSGDVVSLPHDLRIPFARYLARIKSNNFKRYSFGKVVKEKKVFGLHPKEYTECAFDIVTSQSGQTLADAELLVVCQDLVLALGDWEDTKFIFRLGHGMLVKGVLLHLSIPEKQHSVIVEAIKSFAGQKSQLTGRLENLGVSESGISFLLSLLDSDTGLNQLTSSLRSVTKRRGEPAELVKLALTQLKAVETTAVRLGLTFEVQFSVKTLYPPDLYSGMVMQLIRVMPKKAARGMDIVGAGGRYNSLVHSYKEYLELGVQDTAESGEICATGFSLSVDRLVTAISKRESFNPSVAQVLVAGDPVEQAHICSEFWKAGIRTAFSDTDRMDELMELAREQGAEIVIFVTQEYARLSYGDKDGRFLAEKKIQLSEVVNLVTRDLRLGFEADTRPEPSQGKSNLAREERSNTGPSVVYNFNFIDREKYSQSKKRLEIRKSEKLASALSKFDSSCEVLVLALGLPGNVVKSMAGGLEMEDEERFQASLNDLIKLFPRYRKYFVEVCEEIICARFRSKSASSIVLFSLDDNSFKIIH